MGQYLKLFDTHINYQNFVNSEEMLRPNVSHCVQENEVHYNPRGVLPENKELWEKFNQIYGDNVTSEDLQLFSTYPMTYSIKDSSYSISERYHSLEIYTNITPKCFGNQPNPEYKYARLTFTDNNQTASIDDFIRDNYDSNYRWHNADCVK